MIKKIIILGILSVFSLSILQAQNNDSEIKINLEDFDTQNLTNSERALLNMLIQRSVKQLESDIEQLETEKKLGRITEDEFNRTKTELSNQIASKVGQSIDILTDAEDYTNNSVHIIDSFSIDNFNFEYKKENNQRSISISFENECDTTKLKKKKILKHRESFQFGIGFTNWLNADNERYDDPDKKLSGGSSMYYELGFRTSTFLGKERPEKGLKYRSNTSIDYGITLISRYYHFNDKAFSINRDNNGLNTNTDIQYTKSVFSQTALEVPLTLTHHFGKKSRSGVVLSGGIYGGLNLRSRQKIKYSINNKDFKSKWISDFNTNRVYAGAQASIGYNNVYLTARYNFSRLFKSSSPIEVYPYTIGLSIEL